MPQSDAAAVARLLPDAGTDPGYLWGAACPPVNCTDGRFGGREDAWERRTQTQSRMLHAPLLVAASSGRPSCVGVLLTHGAFSRNPPRQPGPATNNKHRPPPPDDLAAGAGRLLPGHPASVITTGLVFSLVPKKPE